ncbi:MAG: hypothetical protein QXO15_07560 [Nitrososphaerota archaeon]
MNNLKREFWLSLYSQGFPQSINDESLHLACMKVEAQACRGKRLRLKGWSFCFGGLHSDDIALISLLAGELGLKQGIDWDWGLESDDYHFEVAYVNGDKVKNLLNLLDLYCRESLVFMNVRLRLLFTRISNNFLNDSEIEKIKVEERKKFEDWIKALRERILRAFNDSIKEEMYFW